MEKYMATPTTNRLINVYALLSRDTALAVFREASKDQLSPNPVVRGIIDAGVGYISLATIRPADPVAERIIKIETPHGYEQATRVLSAIPGIQGVAKKFDTLAVS